MEKERIDIERIDIESIDGQLFQIKVIEPGDTKITLFTH